MIRSLLISTLLIASQTAFGSASYLANTRKDVNKVLSNKIFSHYNEYTLDTIRQGEVGDAQAYFVRLVIPFASDNQGVCLTFIGTEEVLVQPHPCTVAE